MPQPQGLESGVYPFLDPEEYHNDPAVGSSGIKQLNISPARYWFLSPRNPNRVTKKDTPALRFGKAYHAMRLEPKNFPAYVAVEPEEWPTKAVCGVSQEEQKRRFKEYNAHKTIITRTQYELMDQMFYGLQARPEHLNALRGGVPECSIFWRDEETGIMCKIRVDMFAPGWISDLKTIMSIEDKNLRYEFPKRGYDVSGAMYMQGMMELKKMITAGYKMPDPFTPAFVDEFMQSKQQHFCFVFQEKEVPFITRLWRMTSWSAEVGYSKYRKGLYIYHEHKDNENPWPSGFDAIEDIDESMVSQSIQY